MASRVLDACRALADKLTAGGVPADLDAGAVNPGGAWLQPRELELQTLGGWGELTVWVYLVVGDSDNESEAIGDLDELLDKALAAGLKPARGDAADPIDVAASVLLPHSPQTPFPAFRIATVLTV
jgi:hypothetical protein